MFGQTAAQVLGERTSLWSGRDGHPCGYYRHPIQGDVKGIQGDVIGIQGDVIGIQGDVIGTQGDVVGTQGDGTHALSAYAPRWILGSQERRRRFKTLRLIFL
eukprot:7941688-Pyramimonas_sp.AAC.1